MQDYEKRYVVGPIGFEESSIDLIDPRGQLIMFEPPQLQFEYVIGVDPTMGRNGWSRFLRTEDDRDIDNAAIEVFRKNSYGHDIQVAEFAAPIDPYELARVCNLIGRLYKGRDEEGQALMGIEVQPGPGWSVQLELTQRFGYFHFPPWLKTGKGLGQTQTQSYGWYSNRNTRIDLWTRCTSLLNKRTTQLRSQWLVDEMADCTADTYMAITGRARGGLHDDRVIATMLAIWYINEWSLAIEPSEKDEVTDGKPKNYQAMATDEDGAPMSVDRMTGDWNDLADRLLDD